MNDSGGGGSCIDDTSIFQRSIIIYLNLIVNYCNDHDDHERFVTLTEICQHRTEIKKNDEEQQNRETKRQNVLQLNNYLTNQIDLAFCIDDMNFTI